MLRKIMLIVSLIALLVVPATALDGPNFKALIEREDVMAHIRALSVAIGARRMGSEGEEKAAAYIAAAFTDWGYEVETQEFETLVRVPDEEERQPATSRNVIATKPGINESVLVIGAHMDSSTAATGAGDNASGVAAMLAAAKVLSGMELNHTLIFIAFGAEEGGRPSGANVYVEGLSEEELGSITAMINLDSVGIGTVLNVYAGAIVEEIEDQDEPKLEGGPTWVRDLALELAEEMELPFSTTPDETWGGYTGAWSDHYAFVKAGIPIVYFEAWLWEGAENPWWGQETEEGDVMHSEGDIYENVIPDKVEMSAELLAATAYEIATGAFTPPEA